jgi:predicted metalloprotease with PDZ domain
MPNLTTEPICYTVRFPAGHPHYAEIEARIRLNEKDAGKLQVELFLPVWTPGSYLIREYARHVECLTASSPQEDSLTVVKTRKNRWLVSASNPMHEITIRYRIYCNELTPRTNFLGETFALLNGAATFVTVLNESTRSYEVTLELPPRWTGCWSAMSGDANTFRAPDYDCLVDSPIVAGNPSTHTFIIDGKPHILLNFGDASYWDVAQTAHDVEKIVWQYRAMWGELPYDRYLFFNLLTGGRGALEHRSSVVMMGDRFTMRTRAAYAAWLKLVSHEFFHVWNGKRLRPVELGPFDYENEVYTRNLWITEGFTEYYGPLTVRRANLTTVDELLGSDLSGWIESLQNTPGRLQQPVATASFDAWVKLYRPDENSRNSSISYYTKGAVIAWLLDARIRAATDGCQNVG